MTRTSVSVLALVALASVAGCAGGAPVPTARASGYVEATEVRVASKVAGRVERVQIVEGARVAPGDVLATLATTDTDLLMDRAEAQRAQAAAEVRLLRAGARAEDVHQAEAQVAVARADLSAADAEVTAARADEVRFEQLLQKRAGAAKQRDDAVARRELADARRRAAADRVTAATAVVERLRAGARPEELDAAAARVRAIDAELASLKDKRAEATVTAPTAGIVTARLIEPGELLAAGVPVAVIVDLDRAWVNAYVEEPLVPTLRLDQAVTIVTDAGQRLAGKVAVISPRAEFTPRNVQTSAERAKLVYRVKVTLDNREGVLKPGMPVEVQLTPAPGEAPR